VSRGKEHRGRGGELKSLEEVEGTSIATFRRAAMKKGGRKKRGEVYVRRRRSHRSIEEGYRA